jgi:tRNA U34 5-carboxymethylaminomethyl modifying GTPase MnmE/TrmE
MLINTTYEHLQQPMKRHMMALLSNGNSFAETLFDQQRRFETRIRESGLKDKLIHLLAGVQDPVARANQPFEIFVMGEGKHGKSTFINAVLGDYIAKTDWLPKTWCFNRYIALENPVDYIKIFVDLSLLESEDCTGLKEKIGDPVATYRNLGVFHVTKKMADNLIDCEEQMVRDSLGSTRPYYSPIMEIEWSISAPNAILPGIRLVDTMGINQNLAPSSHLHHLKWQYERADAVIWIVAAEKIGARELRKEMLEARRYSKQLIMVINKWDQLDESTKLRALKRAQQEYGELVSSIVPMSSLAAVYAVKGLPPQPSEDEKAWAKSNYGVEKEEILSISGLPVLRDNLRQFLDGRQQRTKNLQTYSALRQKGIEFRTMVSQAQNDAQANIQLHYDLNQKIEVAKRETENQIKSEFDQLEKLTLENIKYGIDTLNYENRNRIRSLLKLDSLENDFRLLINNQEALASERYASIITWLASSSRQYNESHFDPTGRVAESISTLCTTKTNVKVEIEKIRWSIPDPNDFLRDVLIGFGNLISNIPTIGEIFREIVREEKRKAAENIKVELRKNIVPQVQPNLRSAKVRLIEATKLVADDLLEDVNIQFEIAGGIESHKNTLNAAKKVLESPIVEPLLISVPVRVLKKLNWRKF